MDVRLVGAGFAGVVTALTLIERVPDARVTLYEREREPYTTLCGEGISDETLRAFTAFDSAPHIAETFEDVAWYFPEKKEVRVHQRGHTMARETWIPAMARAAEERGARIEYGRKLGVDEITALSREADLVVGCDGPGSVTRKVVGGTHATMLGIQYRVAREGRVPERLEFYTDKRWSEEYSWVFPRGEIMNVGLLASGDGKDWERLDAFMRAVGIEAKILKKEAYPIGFFGTKVQSGNVVLVGDAAGLTNPITKGGMAAVIHAAALLADSVREDGGKTYGARIAKHPLMDPSFAPALAALRRWSNADYARLTRRAPDTIHVEPGRSTERRYLGAMLRTLAENPGKVKDIFTVARAMDVSRRYSW